MASTVQEVEVARGTLAATAPPEGSGTQRGGYIAHRSPDPEAAAAFAVRCMGFSLVHVDDAGRHYLAAAGLDPYSLVFVPGEAGIDHVTFLVDDLAALAREEERLRATGAPVERLDPNPLWRAAPAIRVTSPAGHAVQIMPGVAVDVPMAALVTPAAAGPAPISFDHVAIGTPDVDAEIDFASRVLGLRESARVVAPEVGPVIAFFRSHTLFHCYTIVRLPRHGVHHYQFTLKNAPAVHAAAAAIVDGGEADLVWGPVRHGPGHNVALYFRDKDGAFVEYSAEEEIILDGAGYQVQEWSAADPRFADEWGTAPPADFLA